MILFFNSANRLLGFWGMLILVACTSVKKENPALKEAAQAHEQALEIEQQVKPQLEALVQIKNRLSVQGRTLAPTEQALIREIEGIQTSYDYWEENHVEVPGYEHNHDHAGHSHEGHDHGAKLELTPQDLIVVQREFRDSILVLQRRVEATLQKAQASTTGN